MSANNPQPAVHITPQTPLLPAIQAWEIYLKDQDRSPHTIKAFMGDLNLLANYLPPDRNLGAITTGDLNHFLKWLQDGRGVPCSPKTLARRITSLKSFFRWLCEGGTILDNPAEKVIQRSVISPLPIVLSPDEQTKVVEAAQAYRKKAKPDARPYALISLLLNTSIKKGECLAININHLELDAPQPYLFVRYANPNYRYKERKIDLPQEWLDIYEEYLSQYQPSGPIFPWSPRRLEYLLEEIGENAGIEKHLSFAMCRWTSALNDWRNGMEQEKIRQKLGISKVQWREVSMKLRKLAARINGAEE
ncbi:MAG: site-specific integrase [Anaerolineaceae bacterium]|nr:site-specific integrase [Anaerolineaceae bacterium]